MRKIKEVLRPQNKLKLDQRQIARSCSISVSTVHEYLKRAEAAKVGWPLPEGWDDARLEAALFPPVGSPPQPTTQKSPPDFAAIHEQLQRHRHVTLQWLWDEYRDTSQDGYRYSRFCELYQRWRKMLDVVLRQQHKAGEKAFVDWAGATMPICDRDTARYGRRPCSSPRSAPVPTPGRRSRATSRWSRGCWRMCMLWNIGAACPCWWFPTTPRRESPRLAVMIRMSIRLIRTSPHTTASACYRRDRISRGTRRSWRMPCRWRNVGSWRHYGTGVATLRLLFRTGRNPVRLHPGMLFAFAGMRKYGSRCGFRRRCRKQCNTESVLQTVSDLKQALPGNAPHAKLRS
jgi:hypothetical protein